MKSIMGGGSKGLIQSIFNDFNSKESSEFIDNIQSIVTEYMKLSAYSVGISDLISDDITNQKIKMPSENYTPYLALFIAKDSRIIFAKETFTLSGKIGLFSISYPYFFSSGVTSLKKNTA